MAKLAFKGKPITTVGYIPIEGERAPNFSLTRNNLSEVTLHDFKGRRLLLNIFLSLDTSTCARSVRQFNREAAHLEDTVVLNVSMDLPFAQRRFCVAEKIKNCETVSAFRSTFKKDWRLEILDVRLQGLCSRAVIILDGNHTVLYSEHVSEITNEPDYKKALAALVGKSAQYA